MISQVTLGDCMEGMKQYPDKYFDLAVVDPPYGIGNWVQVTGNLRRDVKEVEWNNIEHRPNSEYFIELTRISNERIIWGANYYNCFDGNMGAIIWDKKNPNPKFSQSEIASYSKHKRVASITIPYYGFVGEEKNFHPCAKPVQLYDWIYKTYLPNGGKVIDTHLGSGSNRIAADKAGNIDFYGWEIDKDYYEAQEKRWKDYKSQLTMF